MAQYVDIVQRYKECQSIRECARDCQVANAVVRKTLITYGGYTTPLISQIAQLSKEGLSQNEIAEKLGCSPSCVNANMPYEKGSYALNPKSENALRIQKCRGLKRT